MGLPTSHEPARPSRRAADRSQWARRHCLTSEHLERTAFEQAERAAPGAGSDGVLEWMARLLDGWLTRDRWEGCRAQARSDEPRGAVMAEIAERLTQLGGDGATPQAHLAEAVCRAIARLTWRQASVLPAWHGCGFRRHALASALNVADDAARKLLRRARRRVDSRAGVQSKKTTTEMAPP